MPNGHGGVPFFAGPVVLAIAFVFLLRLPLGQDGWLAWARVGVCLVLAAAMGWRVAYYLHMHSADEYGGGYTAADAYQRARRRYRIAAPIYSALLVLAALAILRWQGLFAGSQP